MTSLDTDIICKLLCSNLLYAVFRVRCSSSGKDPLTTDSLWWMLMVDVKRRLPVPFMPTRFLSQTNKYDIAKKTFPEYFVNVRSPDFFWKFLVLSMQKAWRLQEEVWRVEEKFVTASLQDLLVVVIHTHVAVLTYSIKFWWSRNNSPFQRYAKFWVWSYIPSASPVLARWWKWFLSARIDDSVSCYLCTRSLRNRWKCRVHWCMFGEQQVELAEHSTFRRNICYIVLSCSFAPSSAPVAGEP